LFTILGSPAKRLVLLRDSFHVVTVDCERARVLSEVDAFLTAVADGRWSTATHQHG
jgi:esterase/lipase